MLKIKSVKQELNFNEISNLVNKHNMVLHHYMHLKNMYDNKNDIKNRMQQDKSKPNNKISHAYASYITDSVVGYFMGKPVSYSFNDEALAEQFNDIFKYNDEMAENTQLATDASIFGCACELMYVDGDLMPRFKAVSPLEVIAIYDCSIEENLISAVRHWKVQVDEEDVDYIEYYTANKIMKFTSDSNGGLVGGVEETEHFFGDVPIVIYENNKDCVGDFEKVTDLINALDKVVSDTANDFEMFSNSIMVIKGVDIDAELFEKLKTMRLMNLVGDGEQKEVSAEYLYKDIPDQALENYKNRLVDNIHMLSGVPNMCDENFANNLSGVAIQFKLSNLEFKCATKESYFRKGLLRRIELICNLQGLMGKVGDTKDIIKNVDIRFTRNVINNTNEMIQQAIQLSSLVSRETVLENLVGLIPSVDEELERLSTEKEESIEFMQDEFNAHQPVEDDEEEQEEQDEE
jgi:SPP1 family phage portal protein